MMQTFCDVLVVFNSKVTDSVQWAPRSKDMTRELICNCHESTPLALHFGTEASKKFFQHVGRDRWETWSVGEVISYAKTDRKDTSCLRAFTNDLSTENAKPAELNGHFLLFAWDKASNQLHVWTDRFGTLHAYYAADGQRAAIGTFFPAVAHAASRRELDWMALTGFFTSGFFPADRTYFRDVRILRPATHYVFDPRGHLVQHERTWKWWHRPDLGRSYGDTLEEFGRILNEVLIDHTRDGRIALPISGGLDSRSTVAVLDQKDQSSLVNPRLWPYSYGYSKDSVEIRIARQIAKARRLPLYDFVIPPYLFDQLDLILASVEGFQDLTQARQAAIVDQLSQNAEYLIAAHWGDVWLNDMGLVDRERNEMDSQAVLEHVLQKLKKGGRTWLVNNLCRHQLGSKDPEDDLRKIFNKEITPLNHIEDADFRVKALKTEQWSFRWTTASLRMFQPGAFPRLPFYDTRLTDFFCTVPSSFVRSRRLQIDFLKQYAPDLARIPWQAYDLNLFHYEFFHSLFLPKRVLKKLWRVLTREHTIERNWEVQFLSEDGRKSLEDWLIRPGLHLHEFVAPSMVHELMDDFYKDPFGQKRGYTISMLLTFSAWLEKYG